MCEQSNHRYLSNVLSYKTYILVNIRKTPKKPKIRSILNHFCGLTEKLPKSENAQVPESYPKVMIRSMLNLQCWLTEKEMFHLTKRTIFQISVKRLTTQKFG